MKIHTIDLINQTGTTIQYTISKFPDGQQDVVISPSQDFNKGQVHLKARLNSFSDLELILCATSALRRLGARRIFLNIPYLLGARADRQFVRGGTSYLADVLAPIINSQGYEQVRVNDVHSDVAAAAIHNLVNEPYSYPLHQVMTSDVLSRRPVIVSPDGGALKRTFKVLELEGISDRVDVLLCNKSRDEKSGRLTKILVPDLSEYLGREFFIIDDICDGGQTFINLARAIREKIDDENTRHKIHLIVTHGIFSKGFDPILEQIDTINFTNTYKTHHITPEYDGRVKMYLIC